MLDRFRPLSHFFATYWQHLRYWKEMACPGIDALSFIQLGNRCYQRTLPSQVATCETEHVEVDLEHFSDAYVNREINDVTR